MAEHTQRTADAVYRFVSAYIDEHGFAPTMREIAKHCYMSVSTAVRYLDRLEIEGRLYREIGKARSIVLLDDAHRR